MGYTQNLQLNQPVPLDPATLNVWGGILNTDFSLIDQAIAGQLILDVSGGTNVILTSNAGAVDQARNTRFTFTGTLTGDIVILFPATLGRAVTVFNNTTGNFELSIGVNDGTGEPAGSTIVIPQTQCYPIYSDGTNISINGTLPNNGGALGPMVSVPSAATVDLGVQGSNFIQITGSNAISSFGTSASTDSPFFVVVFAGTLTLTYNATTLILPGQQSINTQPGDAAICVPLGGGNWQVLFYQSAAIGPNTSSIPVGCILDYTGNVAPSGFLLCYGQEISRTTYANLFGVIGTTYGSGNGTTTFNVPDVRGRTIFGRDNMGGTSANRLTNAAPGGINGENLGATGGEQQHYMTTSELVAHTHGAGHSSSTLGYSSGSGQIFESGGELQTGSAGSGTPFNEIPPGIVFMKIIKY